MFRENTLTEQFLWVLLAHEKQFAGALDNIHKDEFICNEHLA